jgi:hypothetical protein
LQIHESAYFSRMSEIEGESDPPPKRRR